MMRLDDFEVETIAEHFRRFACQPEERVHADAEIRRQQNGDRFCCLLDNARLLGRLTGRANDQRFTTR